MHTVYRAKRINCAKMIVLYYYIYILYLLSYYKYQKINMQIIEKIKY